MNQLVLPSHSNYRQENCLSGGQLLKWMDITACLAAEKHAGTSCVTASMDELYFERQIYVGEVVNLKAQVNRAFNTSMEVGISVRVEDVFTGDVQNVCEAFFTFVALDRDNKKVLLDPLVPNTEKEKSQYTLANERRRMRLQYTTSLRELAKKQIAEVARISETSSGGNTDKDAVQAAKTMLESVELVLPPHANHHRTAFGGQVMSWMEAACTISASRLCRSHPQIRAVDEVKFRGPIKVGDRVLIKSIVNNTYDVYMEVGCRVEAYSIGGEVRHVNSAFFLFVASDDKGTTKVLPRIQVQTEEQKRRALEAMARKQLRHEREEIRKSVGPVIAIPWNPRISQLLNYNNIETLVKLYQLTKWEKVQSSSGVTLFKCASDNHLCVKCTFCVNVPPQAAFRLLSDEQSRREWDPLLLEVRVAEVVDDDDEILYAVLENKMRDATKPDDVVLLVSRRVPSDKRDYYTIAYRSVQLSSLPPSPDYNRREHLCSGLLIKATDGEEGKATLTYINQTTRQLLPYVMGDLSGVTDFYATRSQELESFLLKNVAINRRE